MIKVLVNGALGRMGRTVVAAVKADADLELQSISYSRLTISVR